MNIRWILALTLGCIVCLEWTLCEAAGKKDRSSSRLAEHSAESRGRKPAGRGRKLKLLNQNEEEPHGKRHYRHTSSPGRSKNQSTRRKKCACPPCERCPVCPACKASHPVDSGCNQNNRLFTTENSPIAAIPLDQITSTTPPSTTTTSTTTPSTTTKRTTRRTTTRSPFGKLLQTFGSFGNGFGSSLMSQDKPTGGSFLGGIFLPVRNLIRVYSRISDLNRKMLNGIPNPFGPRTTKAATKCSKKPAKSDEKSKADAVIVAAPKSDAKQVACSKVIELKHPGKIYICME